MRLPVFIILSLVLAGVFIGALVPLALSAPQAAALLADPTPTATPHPDETPPVNDGKRTTPEQIDTGKLVKANACQTPSQTPISQGVIPLSVTATGICFHGGFAVWPMNGRMYALITGGYQAAFVLFDVTDPAHPVQMPTYMWRDAQGNTTPTNYTYTQDAKYFKQGSRHFVSLNQEAFGNTQGYCGVAIVEVTNPASPQFITRLRGAAVNQGGWCDVHNTFVDVDAQGNGAYLYVTADEPDDIRVLDIRNLNNVVELNKYKEPGSTYIHDITVVNGRVYVSYWEAGLIILDAATFVSGAPTTPLTPTGSIKPAGFRVHHALPTPDGQHVFIQDEIGAGLAFQAIRMFDIRNLNAPVEVNSLGIPYRQAHNLLLADGRLYVGWYEMGLQGWDIDTSNPSNPTLTPVAQHTLRSTFTGGFHGAWGVSRQPCQVAGLSRTCLYLADLEMGLDIVAVQDPRFSAADLNQDGVVNIQDLQTVASRWGTRRGDATYYAIFDLNLDGVVNVIDLQAVARQWSVARGQ